MSPYQIAFLVPIVNHLDVAENLLRALAHTTRQLPSSRFLVLTADSSQDARSRVARFGDVFEFVAIDSPGGLGESLNKAIRRLSCPLVAIVTSDLAIADGWLDPMLAAFGEFPSAFAIGNVHADMSGDAIVHAGITFAADGWPINFQPDPSLPQRKRWREFPAVSSACCVLHRDRFLALGGFDGKIETAHQGVDLCLRARMHGWPSFVACQSRIRQLPAEIQNESLHARPGHFLSRWQGVTQRFHLDWAERIAWEKSAGELPWTWQGACRSLARLLSRGPYRRIQPQDVRPDGPIRVLVDFGRLSPGGANGGIKIFVIEMLAAIKRLAPEEIAILWLVPSTLAGEAKSFAGESDEIWLLPSTDGPTNEDPRVYRLMAADGQLARSLNADLLYAPFGVTDFQSADIPTIGIAVDVLHRDYPDTLPQPEIAVREEWFDRMAHAYFRVQCISRWTENQVRQHFPASANFLFVTHCAVQSRIREDAECAVAKPEAFLYPANAWIHKNHDTLLVAYRQYLQSGRRDSWRLVLSGHRDAAMERILAHAKALGIDGHVEFVGYLDLERFSRLWTRAGALVFPSQHEGFGIPVLEAMRLGVPVIAGHVGSIPEVAGDACLHTDMRNPQKIAAALHRVQDDVPLRKTLSALGRAKAAEFSLHAEAEQLLGTFREATAAFKSNGITWRWPNR